MVTKTSGLTALVCGAMTCGAFTGAPLAAHAALLTQFTDIVVSPRPTAEETSAAKDLQYHLRQLTGRELPLRDSAELGTLHFFVGTSAIPATEAAAKVALEGRLMKLPPQGYAVQTLPEGIALAGRDTGVGHAVSLFLEGTCGVRWLWPGLSGEVIPHNPNLELPPLNLSGAPDLLRRKLTFFPRFWDPALKPDLAIWAARTRQGDEINANFGHAWATVMPPKTYFAVHPEWYGLVGGKRIPAQLCTSNPALRNEFVKNLLSLPANQKLDIVSVSANDGYGFCECELCRAKGDTNAAYWDFVNDIANRVKQLKPGLGVGSFAYTYSRQPPKNIKQLPDNVYLSMTSYATQLMLPGGEDDYRQFLAGWKSKGVKIVLREYWGVHYWLDLPVLYPHEIAREIQLAKGAGMIGAYGECGKNFSTQAPNYYVLTHVLWDQNADPEKLLEQFYGAFGPAAGPVKSYYQVLSDAVQRSWREKKFSGTYVGYATSYGSMFDTASLKRAGAALNEADKAAAGDKALQARLAFVRQGYDYTVLMAELLGLYDKLGRSGFPLEAFEWEATAEGARRAFKLPEFAENRSFFEARTQEPFPYTLEQKDAWLRRAWELGQQRIVLLNAARSGFALDEGLYAQTLELGIRQWHATVGKYLGKSAEEYAVLTYTKPAAQPQPQP